MSRYINVKWLQESLELADECKDCKRNVDKCVYANIDVGVVCNAVDDAPSIDIVFCKECKHYHRSDSPVKSEDQVHTCACTGDITKCKEET